MIKGHTRSLDYGSCQGFHRLLVLYWSHFLGNPVIGTPGIHFRVSGELQNSRVPKE